jgi:hypothetical protein
MLARRTLCTLLIASVALLPVAPVRADMISVEAAMTPAAQSPHQALLALLSRPEVVGQLEALGVDRRVAQERIAAMTDAEALALASKGHLLPAGGDYGGGGGGAGLGAILVIVLLVVLLVWLVKRASD